MAPVKRTASIVPRETRATRGSTVARKRNTAAEKEALSPTTKKAATKVSVASSGSITRRSKRITDEDSVEDAKPDTNDSELPRSGRSRSAKMPTTRSTSNKTPTSTTLRPSTRRRIRVTPLDTPVEQVLEVEPKKTQSKTSDATSIRSVSRRIKDHTSAPDEVESEKEEAMSETVQKVAPKTRSTRKTASKRKDTNAADAVAPKTRGRSKKISDEQIGEESLDQKSAAPLTRTTRSNRSGSIALELSVEGTPVENTEASKSSKIQKKVTFQVLPEDDKENQPLLLAKTKRAVAAATKVSKTPTEPSGLRARPLRKAATAKTSTRTKKEATSSKAQPAQVPAQEALGKKLPRALTPKKITQVARLVPDADSDDDNIDISEEEDELNGGKTPVRDLAISPKRPPTSMLGLAMSPTKRLEFNQSFVPKSPNKVLLQQGNGHDAAGTSLTGLARRLPASPFKDRLKDSPKRGMSEHTRLLFPADSRNDASVSVALNPANVSTASQNMATLLQSPKRAGIIDPSIFSHSAIKRSQGVSVFKSSLLGSPAKRLFSPNKKSSTTPSAANVSEFTLGLEGETKSNDLDIEVTASSHFRASASPSRVYTVGHDQGDLDFDESILQVGSPLKLQRSPVKGRSPVTETEQPVIGDTSLPSPKSGVGASRSGELFILDEAVVDPSDLTKTQEADNQKHTADVDLPVSEQPSEVPGSLSPHDGNLASPGKKIDRPESDHIDNTARRQTFSQILFRTASPRSDNESSEDELASAATPARPLVKQREILGRTRSRESTGLPTDAVGQTLGFTPLAAQMSSWLASSPQKTPKPRPNIIQRAGSFEFSPLASQHIDGVVTISRNSTPAQKLASVQSPLPSSLRGKKTPDLRKSITAQQLSTSVLSKDELATNDIPDTQHFDDFMEMHAMDKSLDVKDDSQFARLSDSCQEFDQIINSNDQDEMLTADDTIPLHDSDDLDIISGESRDLTTDLVNFTHASDAAMVDFQKLAEEADALAPAQSAVQDDVHDPSSDREENNGNDSDNDEDRFTGDLVEPNIVQSPVLQQLPSPVLEPTMPAMGSPSILVIDQSPSPGLLTLDENMKGSASIHHTTPARPTPRIHRARVVNTVVSKVPLKPEGHISPIKMKKKRVQSFGDADASPPKRLSLGSLRRFAASGDDAPYQSPERGLRTSVAPSPEGTSTPISRANRSSLGGFSAVTTPGQMTFTVDDFGNSTLDGIEMPDDYENDERIHGDADYSPSAYSVASGLTSAVPTPKAAVEKTPATLKSIRRATSTTALGNSPMTVRKSAARKSTNSTARTPLKPMSNGVLNGATVFVDVYTSEGADASSIFVDLLTQMGAKCVKDWRWNPRASLASVAGGDDVEQRIGISHVVYKDGGKRTLEKVRSTKGEVICVGVAWVLDCERQSKWLDESSYVIDTALLPRGGSRRRKSMEPRALLVQGDGSVSASRPRRSVSAEMSELMKRELVNTPARSHGSLQAGREEENDEDDNDDEDLENHDSATPTGYIAYDPRIAMTPATPYLVSQGKKLIQMTAPPKQQTGRRLFEDENDENDDTFMDSEVPSLDASKSVRDAQKFRMKNLSASVKNRRKTLSFKPIVGSPLSRI